MDMVCTRRNGASYSTSRIIQVNVKCFVHDVLRVVSVLYLLRYLTNQYGQEFFQLYGRHGNVYGNRESRTPVLISTILDANCIRVRTIMKIDGL